MAKKNKKYKKLKSFDDLVARCGGYDYLIKNTGISYMGIYAWRKHGVPQKVWKMILESSDISFCDLAKFDYSIRFPTCSKK